MCIRDRVCLDEKHEGIATEPATTASLAPSAELLTDVDMTSSADRHDMTTSADRKKYPILEVAYPHNMWWSLPPEISQRLYDEYIRGNDASYIWDWGNTRSGSWSPEGKPTTINRYTIDFRTMVQTNSDNKRKRTARWVWPVKEDVAPVWTGQK